MDIQQSTIEAAISLLNVHNKLSHSMITRTAEEKAYFCGLVDMADLILSNCYTHDGYRAIIDEDESGGFVFKGVKKFEEEKEADI